MIEVNIKGEAVEFLIGNYACFSIIAQAKKELAAREAAEARISELEAQLKALQEKLGNGS